MDPEGTRLEIKYKALLRYSSKITKLEDEIIELKNLLGIPTGPCPCCIAPRPSEGCMLRSPAKYAMKGHKGSVTWLAFHPTFTQLATASEDGSIKIWEFETGDFERSLKGHTSNEHCK